MQFEYTEPQTEFERAIGGYHDINAFGAIEPGDDIKFNEFLLRTTPPPRTSVYIDSSGGDVEAAINIGRIIRDYSFSTFIGKFLLNHERSRELIVAREFVAGNCMSAATLIFLGGRLRYFSEESKFGVHQFSFRNPSPADVGHSQVLSAKIARYIADMGVAPDFLELSASVASGIKLLDENDLRRLQVVTGGQTDVSWTIQGFGMLYVRGERDSLYGHQKVALGYAKGGGFLFYAMIEAQGRNEELLGFPVVEIVTNGEQSRIDISDRCERIDGGIYINLFANLTQLEARAIAWSDSFGVHIRFSKDAPVFLGVAAMSTEGGREQLQTFYRTLSADEHLPT